MDEYQYKGYTIRTLDTNILLFAVFDGSTELARASTQGKAEVWIDQHGDVAEYENGDSYAKLTDEYHEWLTANNLPDGLSAEDLVHELRTGYLGDDERDYVCTPNQRAWLFNFIERWERV